MPARGQTAEPVEPLVLIGLDAEDRPVRVPAPDGEDVLGVVERVRREGGRILSIRRGSRGAVPGGVSAEDFARFNEMLATAVRVGAPLPDGVRELSTKVGRPAFRESVRFVADALERGEDLDAAFAPERSGFPRLYGRLLEAGRRAGSLRRTLVLVSRNIRADLAFKRCVAEALVYPAALVVALVMLLSAFAAHILPVYEDTMAEVGPLTRWLVLAAPEARVTLGVALALLIVGAFLWFMVLPQSGSGRRFKEEALRRLPLFGAVYEATLWSNTADILGQLFDNGVPAPDALRLTADAMGSPWAARVLEHIGQAVEDGASLHSAAESSGAPWRVRRALGLGEMNDNVGEEMGRLAEDYRGAVERRARAVTRALPVVLTVVFGVLVLIVALGVLGPFFALIGV